MEFDSLINLPHALEDWCELNDPTPLISHLFEVFMSRKKCDKKAEMHPHLSKPGRPFCLLPPFDLLAKMAKMSMTTSWGRERKDSSGVRSCVQLCVPPGLQPPPLSTLKTGRWHKRPNRGVSLVLPMDVVWKSCHQSGSLTSESSATCFDPWHI